MNTCGFPLNSKESCTEEATDSMIVNIGEEKHLIPLCDCHYYQALRLMTWQVVDLWQRGQLKEQQGKWCPECLIFHMPKDRCLANE